MKISLPAASLLTLGLTLGFAKASPAGTEKETPLKLGGVWKLNRELSENPGAKMMEAMRERGGPGGRGGGGMGGPGGGGGMGGPGGGGGMGGPGGGGMGGGGGRGGGGGMGPGGRGPGGPGGPGGGGMMMTEPPLDGTPDADRTQGPGGGGQGGSRPRPQGRATGEGPGDGDDQNGRGPRGTMGGPIPSPEFTIEQEGDNLAFRTERNLRLLHSDGQKRKKEGEGGKLDVTARFLKGSLLIESRPEMGGKRKETYTLLPDGKLQIDFDIEGAGPMAGLKFKLVYDAAPSPQF